MILTLDKTMEMVVKRKVDKRIPPPVCGIEQKPGLKLLGVHLSDNTNNWDKQFKHLMQKANSRMYILRVCKNHGYGRDDLHLLFNSLIMSLFTRAGRLRVLKCGCFVFICRRRRRRGVELLIGSRPLITRPDWFAAS